MIQAAYKRQAEDFKRAEIELTFYERTGMSISPQALERLLNRRTTIPKIKAPPARPPAWKADLDRKRRQLDELQREIAEDMSFDPPREISRLEQDGLLTLDRIYRDDMSKKRMVAVYALLRSIPTSDYKKLAHLAEKNRFIYNTSEHELRGFVHSIDGPAIYIFLAAGLEKAPNNELLYVAAHEIAHIVSGHIFRKGDRALKEREADALAAAWGYPEP